MTPHNEANINEIAKTVLMPGDPLRAKMIAETYLEDYKLVNSIRNIYAYTGTFKGKEVTIMALYDTVLVTDSYSKSSYAKVMDNYNDDIISSSEELNKKIEETANKLDKKVTKGRIHSSDCFYGNADISDLYNNKKCLGVEMESFGLFFNAKKLGKKAACILTVSDNLITHEETSSEERQNAFKDMIEIALNTAINL